MLNSFLIPLSFVYAFCICLHRSPVLSLTRTADANSKNARVLAPWTCAKRPIPFNLALRGGRREERDFDPSYGVIDGQKGHDMIGTPISSKQNQDFQTKAKDDDCNTKPSTKQSRQKDSQANKAKTLKKPKDRCKPCSKDAKVLQNKGAKVKKRQTEREPLLQRHAKKQKLENGNSVVVKDELKRKEAKRRSQSAVGTSEVVGKLTNLKLDQDVSCLAMHPHSNYAAIGLVSGDVDLYEYTRKPNRRHSFLTSIPPAIIAPANKSSTPGNSSDPSLEPALSPSCTCIAFSDDGQLFCRGSSNGDLEVFNATRLDSRGRFKRLLYRPAAHSECIRAVRPLSPRQVATGDESGVIRLWDVRTGEMMWEGRQHNDSITSLLHVSSEDTLVAASADGTISAMGGVASIAAPGGARVVTSQSEEVGEGLLSLCLARDGATVLAGGQGGGVWMWRWGGWAAPVDRLPRHPEAVNGLAATADGGGAALTACDDGHVRLFELCPHRLVGVPWAPPDRRGAAGGGKRKGGAAAAGALPVEGVAVDYRGAVMAVWSHGRRVRFVDLGAWAVEGAARRRVEAEMERGSDAGGGRRRRRRRPRGKRGESRSARGQARQRARARSLTREAVAAVR